MRALSLNAGITMLYFGLCSTPTFLSSAVTAPIRRKTQDIITSRGSKWPDSCSKAVIRRQTNQAGGSNSQGMTFFLNLMCRMRLCCDTEARGYDEGRSGGKGYSARRPDSPRWRGHRGNRVRFRDFSAAERRQNRDSRLRLISDSPTQPPHWPQPQDWRARGSSREARPLLQTFKGTARPGKPG